MNAHQVGEKLVAYCKKGENLKAIDELYSKDVVSLEPVDMPGGQREIRGIDGVRKKNKAWFEGNDIHSTSASGPFPHGDRFTAIFGFDVTPKEGPMKGKRMQGEEIALYTVKDGKIVKEEFFYSM